jgi:hypothetical protein
MFMFLATKMIHYCWIHLFCMPVILQQDFHFVAVLHKGFLIFHAVVAALVNNPRAPEKMLRDGDTDIQASSQEDKSCFIKSFPFPPRFLGYSQ